MTATQIESHSLSAIALSTRDAARQLAVLSTEAKNRAIEAIAQSLEAQAEEILAANAADCKAAEAEKIAVNNPVRNSVDKPNSRSSLLSSSSVYIVSEGLMNIDSSAIIRMTA